MLIARNFWLMNDTAPNIAAIVRERLLSRPGAERVVMGSRMFDVARTIALASFPPVFLSLNKAPVMRAVLWQRA
jgi:hypothetical protein